MQFVAEHRTKLLIHTYASKEVGVQKLCYSKDKIYYQKCKLQPIAEDIFAKWIK